MRGLTKSVQLTATTDANGDLVYSSAAGLYGAYFVVTGMYSPSRLRSFLRLKMV